MTNSPKSATSADQIDRFKELAGELSCDEGEAALEVALKKLVESTPVPKHLPEKRSRVG